MIRALIFILSLLIVFDMALAADVDDCAKRFGTFGLKRNSQIVIWELIASGRFKAAERLKQEVTESLKKSAIAKFEVDQMRAEMSDLTFLEFVDGRKGAWKTWNDDFGNPKRAVMREVTVYKFDQLIGANIVPITVARKFNGRPGVVQLFVRDVDDVALVPNPNSLRLFDFLIAHEDRIAANHLTHQGRTIAIDNESAFLTTEASSSAPDFVGYIQSRLEILKNTGKSDVEKAKVANEISVTLISKDVVERLRSLSDADFKRTLSELNPAEFKAFLDRKNRALAAIDEAEKAVGPSIYPTGRFSALSRDSSTEMRERLRQYLANRRLLREQREPAKKALEILGSADLHNRPLTEAESDFVKQTMRDLEGM